ncbi:MAG TPA: FKBP-type peptidyl-prolyl cis-trans isomerase [Candidatus Deferrimicrobiaceae bacterium]|jgi:FKBP-type peptidyl-prolyl cis-trans isomerase FklB
MKIWGVVVLAVVLSANLAFGGDGVELKDKKDKVSYGIGLSFGNNLKANIKNDDIEIDQELLLRGLRDAFTGASPALSDNQLRETMMNLQSEVTAHQEAKAKAALEKNKKQGEDFLLANKGKDNVITLPSGLQYKVIKEGTGVSPKPTDLVETHYSGTLIDGTEFDSSYKRNQPAVFPVNGVIPGWTEALQKMKVGSKWQLFVPSELAYGTKGAGNLIGPNATLIFEVELLSIKEGNTAGGKGGGMGGGMGGMRGH